ncbi:metallophosphoesterase [Crenobacter sp. SG2305]|uniref:metallophosphoesterase n=1 Tax=Crenobacter oryzisoli TaxID=3056844 RepID=UPI0025AB091B|nr:metallophosphoesterase [Crenobacter sp. SG2305]MDN0083257.1 metallophosphoesterase [Crenobacter sp. SG2305]
MAFDVIGDVHGHVEALDALLYKLGYREQHGAWRHPDRTAVFVGDLIDRGPGQLRTLDRVRRMVDAGSALMTMGNHEFNALAWATPDPDMAGEFLRPHNHKNRHQHAAFLSEMASQPQLLAETLDWFMSLPLWLELPGLRVVHACWHPEALAVLRGRLTPERTLTAATLVEAARRPHPDASDSERLLFDAVESVLKGLEATLPDGLQFHDKDGRARRQVRIRWWDSEATTWQQAAEVDATTRAKLPATPLPVSMRLTYSDPIPVLFGHYWQRGAPAVHANGLAACLDYSVARGGQLMAYRWEGEPRLDAAHFVSVPAMG